MRKSKKTIIYMLVALFAAVSTVLVDFNISYAQSSYSDVPDADWKLMQGGNVKDPGCNVGISDNYSTDFPVLQQSLDKAKYTESCAYSSCLFSPSVRVLNNVLRIKSVPDILPSVNSIL